jgi:hypothetical protein
MIMRICTKCNQEKLLEEFSKKGLGTTNFKANKPAPSMIDVLKKTCKACDAAYAREFRKANKNYRGSGMINKYPMNERLVVSAIGSRLADARSRSQKGFATVAEDLDRDWLYALFLSQEGKCALSGVALRIERKHPVALSLDQIEPSQGYVKGNVQWVAWAVNRAKGDLPTAMFIDMCKKITERCNDYPVREYIQVDGSAKPLAIG